jgi:uncharacterized protein YqjF (DUF2071 family)
VETGVQVRITLPVPGIARFGEINVRTYATLRSTPGIYFFSLDTPTALQPTPRGASTGYRTFARGSRADRHGETIWYQRARRPRRPSCRHRLEYAPAGSARRAEPGSFEPWAAERYRLYTLDGRQRVLRRHPPPAVAASARPGRFRSEQVWAARSAWNSEASLCSTIAGRQDVVFWLNQLAETRRVESTGILSVHV